MISTCWSCADTFRQARPCGSGPTILGSCCIFPCLPIGGRIFDIWVPCLVRVAVLNSWGCTFYIRSGSGKRLQEMLKNTHTHTHTRLVTYTHTHSSSHIQAAYIHILYLATITIGVYIYIEGEIERQTERYINISLYVHMEVIK